MSKTMKRILVFAVSFMMIVSSASVFAAEELTGIDVTKEGPKTSSEKKETKGKTALSSESEKGAKSKDLKAEAYCTAVTRNYNTTKASNPAYISTNGSSSWTVYSVYVKATGYLSMDVETGPNNDYSAQFAVGTFDGSTFTYYGPKSVSAGSSEEFIGGMDVKAGNTYWFGVKTSGYAEAYCAPYVVPYTTRSLPAGKTMLTAARKNGTATTALYKIKATKTGYISVALKEYGSSSSAGYVTLLNSKKKAISDKLWYYTASKTSYVVFGVKKGTVYYLKCNLPYGMSSKGYTYGTAWKNYGASYAKNLKKAKSLKLKRKGKARNMARPATGKKMVQWYKFKVPKKQKTVIKVNAANIKSGSAKLVLYAGKKKIGTATISKGYKHTFTITNGTTYGKANKGTYYAAIVTSAKCSGQYKIQYSK